MPRCIAPPPPHAHAGPPQATSLSGPQLMALAHARHSALWNVPQTFAGAEDLLCEGVHVFASDAPASPTPRQRAPVVPVQLQSQQPQLACSQLQLPPRSAAEEVHAPIADQSSSSPHPTPRPQQEPSPAPLQRSPQQSPRIRTHPTREANASRSLDMQAMESPFRRQVQRA